MTELTINHENIFPVPLGSVRSYIGIPQCDILSNLSSNLII